MKTNKQLIQQWLLLLTILISFSCGGDDEGSNIDNLYENGVFITNEGPFQTGTGTVSFYDRSTQEVTNGIFEAKNGRPLGNIVQSMQIHNELGYVVVNNSNKMEVVDPRDFSSVGVVENLEQPRYFLGIDDDKGYVSLWGSTGLDGKVAVVDLTSFSVTKTIDTGIGSEEMARVGDRIYVCNSGVFGVANTLSVIDITTDELLTNIEVGDNPQNIEIDMNGFLWVACTGAKIFNQDFSINLEESTSGRLVMVDPSNNEVQGEFVFEDVSLSPSRLSINNSGNTLFYLLGGSVFSQSVNSMTPSTTPIISGFFYGLGIDPVENIIYASDAGDFASDGQVMRFNSDGTLIDTFQVGVIPGDFFFN